MKMKKLVSNYYKNKVLLFYICISLFTGTILAQHPSVGVTKVGQKSGYPLSSADLSDFDKINPYNGKLSLNLPLLNVGGRGDVGYQMVNRIERNWSIERDDPPVQGTYAHRMNTHFWASSESNDYSPGEMALRTSGDGSYTTSCNTVYQKTVTYFTFTFADGTQKDFYDAQTNGTTLQQSCPQTNYSRGTIFYSTDGNGDTFISDYVIEDSNNGPSSSPYAASGYLKFKNGIVYRINKGSVDWAQDRNGNKLIFTYENLAVVSGSYLPGRLLKITDSLNRKITITPATPQVNLSSDLITYNGSDGSTRTIKINYSYLSNNYRAGSTQQTIESLFGNVYLTNAQDTPDFIVVSSMELPGGKIYEFKYNSYGEVARIVLPTGGAIEYDYDGGIVGFPPIYSVYRRVIERRIYADGINLTQKTSYLVSNSPNYVIEESRDSNNVLLQKTQHYYLGKSARDSIVDYSLSDPFFHSPWFDGLESQTDLIDTDGTTVLQRTIKDWQARYNRSWGGETPQIISTNSIIEPNGANLLKKETYNFDQYGNTTDIYEYDFGIGNIGAFKRRTHIDYVTDTNYISYIGSHLRGLPSQTWISSDTAGNSKVSLTQFEYDNYSGGNNAPLRLRSNVTGHDTTNYGTNFTRRGNVTKVTSYGNAQAQTEPNSVYSNYDVLGNVVKTIDAKGYTTTIDYTDRFGAPDSEARGNTSPAELGGLSTFAFPTSSTNALDWVTGYSQFDYYTGQAVDVEDINGVVSSMFYNDPLDRLTTSITANNQSNFRRQSTIVYDDVNRKITSQSDLDSFNDGKLKSESFYDGLGRTVESRRYEAGGGYVATKSIPFAVISDPETSQLRVATQITKPYRPNAGEQPVWTTSLSDSLGRNIKVVTPDGAFVKRAYSGNAITVTDQAGEKRRTIEDALGRLIRVDEPDGNNDLGSVNNPYQPTNYIYDALGNLTQIVQGGQTRSFFYSSLSRLLSATNPESGTFIYIYDDNGNLYTKKDARNITTTYTYDALNRITLRDYSDSTPDITYSYDDLQVPFSKGKLTKVSSSVSETKYTGFDAQERIIGSQQITEGQTYNFGYTYNLNGDLLTQTYPSTKVVKFDYTNDGDLEQVSNNQTQKIYANSFSYNADGKTENLRLGNGKWETTQFNSLGQITQVGLGHSIIDSSLWRVNYEYGKWESGVLYPQKNNNNLARQTIIIPTIGQATGFTAVQTYDYDSLDRLKSAVETVGGVEKWKQTIDYDRFGNKRLNAANTTLLSSETNIPKIANPEILVTNNHYKADQDNDGQNDYLYDTSGNLTKDAKDRTFTYDGENRELTAVGNNLSVSYAYDGNDKRVKSFNAVTNQTTIFVYDADGDLAAEYTVNVPPPTSPTITYLTNDSLGSPRILTDSFGQVKSRRDFLPFGEELYAGIGNRTTNQQYSANEDLVRQKFTGYQRDVETNLDYAQSRYYSPMHGRFTSPDEFKGGPDELFDFEEDASDNPTFYANLTNPQTLNKYQYTYNNPCKYRDPTGHDPCLRQVAGTIGGVIIGGVVGGSLGGVIGGIAGGGGGAAACAPTGPGAALCGAGGFITGGAIGTIAGGAGGSLIGGTVGARAFPCPPTNPSPSSSANGNVSTGTVSSGAAGISQMAHKPKKQSTGSRKRTGNKHDKGTSRNAREQKRKQENLPKPKPKTPKRTPGTPRKNKYPPETGPNATPKPPKPVTDGN